MWIFHSAELVGTPGPGMPPRQLVHRPYDVETGRGMLMHQVPSSIAEEIRVLWLSTPVYSSATHLPNSTASVRSSGELPRTTL